MRLDPSHLDLIMTNRARVVPKSAPQITVGRARGKGIRALFKHSPGDEGISDKLDHLHGRVNPTEDEDTGTELSPGDRLLSPREGSHSTPPKSDNPSLRASRDNGNSKTTPPQSPDGPILAPRTISPVSPTRPKTRREVTYQGDLTGVRVRSSRASTGDRHKTTEPEARQTGIPSAGLGNQ